MPPSSIYLNSKLDYDAVTEKRSNVLTHGKSDEEKVSGEDVNVSSIRNNVNSGYPTSNVRTP